jgi:hypothetical protein
VALVRPVPFSDEVIASHPGIRLVENVSGADVLARVR